jgi:hypothetical protein
MRAAPLQQMRFFPSETGCSASLPGVVAFYNYGCSCQIELGYSLRTLTSDNHLTGSLRLKCSLGRGDRTATPGGSIAQWATNHWHKRQCSDGYDSVAVGAGRHKSLPNGLISQRFLHSSMRARCRLGPRKSQMNHSTEPRGRTVSKTLFKRSIFSSGPQLLQ